MEGILTQMFAHQNAPRVDIENYLTAASHGSICPQCAGFISLRPLCMTYLFKRTDHRRLHESSEIKCLTVKSDVKINSCF